MTQEYLVAKASWAMKMRMLYPEFTKRGWAKTCNRLTWLQPMLPRKEK